MWIELGRSERLVQSNQPDRRYEKGDMLAVGRMTQVDTDETERPDRLNRTAYGTHTAINKREGRERTEGNSERREE